VSFESWTGDRTVAAIGTNSGSASIPFQSWRTFKEAFAPELIHRAVNESGEIHTIVDPFGGSGTTALAAQFLGATPTTIEVNPFLADLIEAKIAQYDFDALVSAYSEVRHKAKGRDEDCSLFLLSAPSTFLEPGWKGRYLFSRRVASRYVAYKMAIEQVSDTVSRRLLSVLLASLSVSVSNAVVSGKGRRYRKIWKERPVDPDQVDRSFERLVLDAIRDLRRYDARRSRDFTLLRGDARKLVCGLPTQDLAIFSPPYPNSFDYTDVYNIELWMGGYLTAAADNRLLREETLRSHVQILRSMTYDVPKSLLLENTIDQLQAAKERLWNRNIPEMIGAYFDDMARVLRGLRECLRSEGRVYMVVGDSRYANIDVPVGRILGEQASDLGFEVISSEPFRSMRASPQQGGQSELPETLVVLTVA
jgi:DNA modification methylase